MHPRPSSPASNGPALKAASAATTMPPISALPPLNHPPPPGTPNSDDSRAYLDRQSGTWRYEDHNGDEWEWQTNIRPPSQSNASEHHHHPQQQQEEETEGDPTTTSSGPSSTSTAASLPKGHWVKLVDEELIQAQQAAYSVPGADQTQPAADPPSSRRSKKRKAVHDVADASAAAAAAAGGGGSGAGGAPPKKPKPITSLYVSGLPLDSTAEEIAKVFSRYGLLLEDDEGKPRIKMYHDAATGQFRGEALVVYFKPESVELAINLLDDTSLRAAIGQTGGPTMRVQRAEFPGSGDATRQRVETPRADAKAAPSSSSSANPSTSNGGPSSNGSGSSLAKQAASGSRRNLSDQDRKKIQKRVARMENKLTDWDSPDEDAAEATATTSLSRAASSQPRTVVLKKMFTLVELDEDPTLLLDLKEDVREECEGIGSVTNVVLWDNEPEGVMTIKFREPAAAQACVKRMDGRFFAGRRIDAFLLEGKARFRKTDKGGNVSDEDEEEQRRADAFGEWLESGNGD